MSHRPRIRWTLGATAFALLVSVAPAAASSPSPSTIGEPAVVETSTPAGVATAALPTAFAWEPLALPRRNVDELPWLVVGAIPGERTILRAYWSDVGNQWVVRKSRLWTSTDVATWAQGKDGGVWSGGNQWIMGGHRPNTTPAWLAVGDGVHVMAFDGELRTSPDGQRWKPVKLPKKLQDRFWDVAGVVRTTDGFLAVGQMLDAPLAKDPGIQPAAFSSPDGKTWSVEPIAPAPGGAIRAMAVAPDDTVVATGVRGKGDAAESVLWVRTSDGTWTAMPLPGDGTVAEVVQLGHAAGRFFLQLFDRETVDGKERFRYTLWTSPDGLAWEPGPSTGLTEPTRLAMAAGAIDGGVLIALNPPEPGPMLVRWSPDWVTWTESTIPGIDGHYLDAPLGRLHDGRPVLVAIDPERRSRSNGLSIAIPIVATPVAP